MENHLIHVRHDAWATGQMLGLCRSLSDQEFHRRFDIGPGSVHDTFVHVVGCMVRWSDRIAQRPLRASPEDDRQRRTVDELRAMLDAGAADLESVARQVHEQNQYDDTLEFPRGDGKPPYRFAKKYALVHVTTHGMHHRAQLRWMMRQLGVEFGNQDFDPIEMELVATGQF